MYNNNKKTNKTINGQTQISARQQQKLKQSEQKEKKYTIMHKYQKPKC